MTKWLIRLFIKNPQDTKSQPSRAAYGTLGSMVGIGLNILLSLAKFIIGLATGSVAITADAGNNLSDAGGAGVSLISTRLAQKPQDQEHPFGHGRMEYIGALGLGLLILIMGVELLKAGITSIIHPAALIFSWLSFGLLLGGVLLKGWLIGFYAKLGRQIDSAALQAASKDSLSDVLSSSAVLLSMLADHFFHWALDGYMGVLVALVVLKTGFQVCKGTIDRLLGAKPSKEQSELLLQKLLAYDGILGAHDLVIHDYGPGRCIASVHAEVSAKGDIVKIHELIDQVEREISKEMNLSLLIHMDPIVTDDAETNEARARMEAFLLSTDPRLKLHDFRRVPGEKQVTLVFDVLVPAEYGPTEKLENKIEAFAQELDTRNKCLLHFDLDYFH